MTRVLALDTATLTATAAVTDDDRLLAARDTRVSTHSEQLLALIDGTLADAKLTPADLELVACGAGPGSFTGLRIGLATAKGLAFALGKPLLVVSSLAALAVEGAEAARASAPGTPVLALLDAHKQEVYAGLYRFDGASDVPARLAPEVVLAPTRLVDWVRSITSSATLSPTASPPVIIVGDGALAYPAEATAAGRILDGARATPRAAAIAMLALARLRGGASDELAAATPSYIRPSEAELKFPR